MSQLNGVNYLKKIKFKISDSREINLTIFGEVHIINKGKTFIDYLENLENLGKEIRLITEIPYCDDEKILANPPVGWYLPQLVLSKIFNERKDVKLYPIDLRHYNYRGFVRAFNHNQIVIGKKLDVMMDEGLRNVEFVNSKRESSNKFIQFIKESNLTEVVRCLYDDLEYIRGKIGRFLSYFIDDDVDVEDEEMKGLVERIFNAYVILNQRDFLKYEKYENDSQVFDLFKSMKIVLMSKLGGLNVDVAKNIREFIREVGTDIIKEFEGNVEKADQQICINKMMNSILFVLSDEESRSKFKRLIATYDNIFPEVMANLSSLIMDTFALGVLFSVEGSDLFIYVGSSHAKRYYEFIMKYYKGEEMNVKIEMINNGLGIVIEGDISGGAKYYRMKKMYLSAKKKLIKI